MKNINWQNIAKAIDFYTVHGFEYIETPWIVDYKTIEITCPDPQKIITVDESGGTLHGLVGSAEQGFLQLVLDGKLSGVNYVSAGSCFRLEKEDELHQSQFFKVELFSKCINGDRAIQASRELLRRANKFMNYQAVEVQTEEGFDLEINGVEVGSYGARFHSKIGWWAYGTGVAEPRYSYARKMAKING